jgi:hypothetical protein
MIRGEGDVDANDSCVATRPSNVASPNAWDGVNVMLLNLLLMVIY